LSTDTLKLWRHLFGGQSGILAIFSGQRIGQKEIDRASAKTHYFDYPAKAEAALSHALQESESGREAYFCAHLLTARRRTKENAAPALALWGESDGAEVPMNGLGPTALVESSPGRFHVYYRLTDAIPPELAENLNKRLALKTGADPSGFDLTQLLRVPGTVNHKYPDSPVVRILELHGGRSYSPHELDEALPEIETKHEPRNRNVSDEPPVALGEQALRVWRGEDPKLKEDGTVDRSASLVKIGRAVYDAGGNRLVIETALEERDRTLGWNKYTGRRDAGECYAGIVDELEKNGRNGKAWITVGGKKPPNEQDTDSSEQRKERRNQADRLIGYALEDVQELFVDQHGAPHALIGGDPVPLTSRCYSWFRKLMWEEEGRSVSGEYLKMAAGTLSAHAEFSGEVRQLYTRAAWHEGILYYELRPGKVVRVGPGGWTFEANPPVLFRRYVNLKALPDPEAGGDLGALADALTSLVNLKSDRDRRLLAAYAATVALPHVGRPILLAGGPMGSGKTTLGRMVKRLWDPTVPETVRYDPRDILQKALHAYILMLDNLSTLPESAADSMCRFVTGEGDSKRKLYTDDEDVIVEIMRAVILTAINAPTDRGDLLDRSLAVELERIPDNERRTDEELWAAFEREHSRILGAALDILGKAIAFKPSIKLSWRPRLADWGEYAAAVYEVMGWGAETFLNDWDEVVKVQNQATLDGSPVAQAIIKFMQDMEEYTGTSSEMHSKLKVVAAQLGVDVERDKAWPKSARWLWRRIKEVLPLLVAAGIEASRGRDESAKQITLRRFPTNDGSDGSRGESRTDKGETHANTAQDDGRSNGSGDANGMPDGSENPPSNAASANNADIANRYGDFSEEVGTPEQEERIRRLVGQGMSETWARRTVLADSHPLDCDCEVCL
jgi:hypothetical protein